MHILLTAPFVGEIGWELMAWQGRVRQHARARHFDRIVVLGGAGKAEFYAGVASEYRVVDLSGLPGCAYEDRRYLSTPGEVVSSQIIRNLLSAAVEATAADYRAADHHVQILWPEYEGKFTPTAAPHQQFAAFKSESSSTSAQPSVVLIQRTRSLGAERNWSPDAWSELQSLLEARGINVQIYPEEAGAAIQALSAADLAIGQSTGGMHLAALCGCPRVVWGLEDYLWTTWEFTNQQRYETIWNPLRTPTVYHARTQQPTPQEVSEWVAKGLNTIGRRTGSQLHRACFEARWRTSNLLINTVMSCAMLKRLPWPVQRWVRYGLV